MDGHNLTLKGLKFIIIGYTLLFVSSGLALALSVGYISPEISRFVLFLGIIILVSLAIIYYGIKNIYKGNKEFSEEHEKNTLIAKKLVTFGIIFYIISLFVVSILIFPLIRSDFSFIINIYQILLFIPFWLALVFLIKGISNDTIVKLLWFAFFSRLILFLISRVSYEIGESLNIVSDTDYSFVYIVAIIAMIPSLIFIYCYHSTYIDIKISEITNKQNLGL